MINTIKKINTKSSLKEEDYNKRTQRSDLANNIIFGKFGYIEKWGIYISIVLLIFVLTLISLIRYPEKLNANLKFLDQNSSSFQLSKYDKNMGRQKMLFAVIETPMSDSKLIHLRKNIRIHFKDKNVLNSNPLITAEIVGVRNNISINQAFCFVKFENISKSGLSKDNRNKKTNYPIYVVISKSNLFIKICKSIKNKWLK
ncbi:hypothetical protein [Rhizosphaericola mali]|uniref:Uncharacterized protein n=1 Tax=Rhizosphaericola mali TaxID=2545455 RepID=A0A5P2G7X9_9BACT|nr:hypothetical protein [Rhizosphaericola mali]QES87631.1 hypothetical protein E0W69_002750 [Rhizosphaericola mali]